MAATLLGALATGGLATQALAQNWLETVRDSRRAQTSSVRRR